MKLVIAMVEQCRIVVEAEHLHFVTILFDETQIDKSIVKSALFDRFLTNVVGAGFRILLGIGYGDADPCHL